MTERFVVVLIPVAVYGSGASGFADGSPETAQFWAPHNLCLYSPPPKPKSGGGQNGQNGQSGQSGQNNKQPQTTLLLLCSDSANNRIRAINLTSGTGYVSTYVGSGLPGNIHGSRTTKTRLYRPYAICLDPTNSGSFFIGDTATIRYCDGATGLVSLVCGGEVGYTDGIGRAAKLHDVYSILFSSCNGVGTLYVCDHQNRVVRSVTIKISRTHSVVQTVCGNRGQSSHDGVGVKTASFDGPHQMCFYRSRSLHQPDTKSKSSAITATTTTRARPESVIFIASNGGLRRFDIQTRTFER